MVHGAGLGALAKVAGVLVGWNIIVRYVFGDDNCNGVDVLWLVLVPERRESIAKLFNHNISPVMIANTQTQQNLKQEF